MGIFIGRKEKVWRAAAAAPATTAGRKMQKGTSPLGSPVGVDSAGSKKKEEEWWKKSKKKKKKLKRKKIRVLPMTGGQASAHKTSLKPSKMVMATVQVEEDEDEESRRTDRWMMTS
ncbi:hypothetical protein RUM43_011819 [Polyplax serrata]|uniref:Uncharacterized protein n=1 Tax=Polyplax serrata TaxID=468196 RepID=A0AAN8P6J0_POLSC